MFIIAILILTCILYYFYKEIQRIRFNKKQGDEIFKYLEDIISLQKELIQKMQSETNKNNIELANLIFQIIEYNNKEYDNIKPKLFQHIKNNNNKVTWRYKFNLPLIYTLDKDNNKIEIKF